MKMSHKLIASKNAQKIMGVVVVVLFLWNTTSADRGQTVTAKMKANQLKSKNRRLMNRGSGNVDAQFWKRIKDLLKIVIPSYNCKEFKYLSILTLLLVLRTQMSIWLADVNGKIVKAIVERNFQKFVYRIMNLMLFSIPSSAVNSGMEYFSKLLSVAFRERITAYFHDLYLQ